MVIPLIQHVVAVPAREASAIAMITLYIFLIGAVGGSLTAAWLTDEFSTTRRRVRAGDTGQPHRRH